MYAKITKDFLFEPTDSNLGIANRTGLGWAKDKSRLQGEIFKIRLLDDDRIPYYLGESDDQALESVFDWAMRDSGCTILQVKTDGNWVDTLN